MFNSSFSIHAKDSLLWSLAALKSTTPALANAFPFEHNSAGSTVMWTRQFTFSPKKLIHAPIMSHNSLYGRECSDPSTVKTDNFLLQYKIFTAVKAGLKITHLFLPLFLSLHLFCQVGGPLLFLFNAWAWPLSWELAQLDPLFSFPLLANFPDNWSRMQTEGEKGGFEADAKAWQSVSALCNGCAHPLSITTPHPPVPPPVFLPPSLTRTGFIICDKVPMVWEESALDVYYIRSARTNGETPTDHVIATGQQGNGYKTVLLLPPLSPSVPLFLFCTAKNTHPHRKGHTRLETLLQSLTYAIYLTQCKLKINNQLYIFVSRSHTLLCQIIFVWLQQKISRQNGNKIAVSVRCVSVRLCVTWEHTCISVFATIRFWCKTCTQIEFGHAFLRSLLSHLLFIRSDCEIPKLKIKLIWWGEMLYMADLSTSIKPMLNA